MSVSVRLSNELRSARCKVDDDRFREVVASIYAKRYGTMPDERLTDDPWEALEFCEDVRKQIDSPGVHETTILRTLRNLRKQSDLFDQE
jgi:hypothetical protein